MKKVSEEASSQLSLQVAIFDMMDPQARQDCLKEVRILQNLEHGSIVKCFNSFIQASEWMGQDRGGSRKQNGYVSTHPHTCLVHSPGQRPHHCARVGSVG